jgi:hypothetical protein
MALVGRLRHAEHRSIQGTDQIAVGICSNWGFANSD